MNKVELIGRLGKDPELRYTQTGSPIATLSLATTEKYKNKKGEQQESTEWHKIILWGSFAEFISKQARKGDELFVLGKITTRSWEGKDGKKNYSTEINAQIVKLFAKIEHQQQHQSQQSHGLDEQNQMNESDIPF